MPVGVCPHARACMHTCVPCASASACVCVCACVSVRVRVCPRTGTRCAGSSLHITSGARSPRSSPQWQELSMAVTSRGFAAGSSRPRVDPSFLPDVTLPGACGGKERRAQGPVWGRLALPAWACAAGACERVACGQPGTWCQRPAGLRGLVRLPASRAPASAVSWSCQESRVGSHLGRWDRGQPWVRLGWGRDKVPERAGRGGAFCRSLWPLRRAMLLGGGRAGLLSPPSLRVLNEDRPGGAVETLRSGLRSCGF